MRHADLLLRLLLYQLVAVLQHRLQLAHGVAGCLVDDGLVHVPHGILGNHQRVGLVILTLSHAHAALDLQCTLAPDVKILGIDVVAQAAVVSARGLAAEQDIIQRHPFYQVTRPHKHTAEAHRAVLECFVAQFLDALQRILHVNCACIDLFFGNIDADDDFFHTFAPFLITGSD